MDQVGYPDLKNKKDSGHDSDAKNVIMASLMIIVVAKDLIVTMTVSMIMMMMFTLEMIVIMTISMME